MPEHFSSSLVDVVELMREKGISPTRQRTEIARAIFVKPQHVSADQVLSLVNRRHHNVSKATVYNTLGLFARKGLVREVIIDPNKVFYDTTTAPHHHFYNMDTGELQDVGMDSMVLTELPALPEGTVAEGVDVVIKIRNASASKSVG